MKQTAVEFLSEKYNEVNWLRNRDEISSKYADELREGFFYQAKEIEKQQIIDAANQDDFVFQRGFGMYDDVSAGQQYYNETFKNK